MTSPAPAVIAKTVVKLILGGTAVLLCVVALVYILMVILDRFFGGVLDRYSESDFTLNGLTSTGKFLTVNGRDEDAIGQLTREEGLQQRRKSRRAHERCSQRRSTRAMASAMSCGCALKYQ